MNKSVIIDRGLDVTIKSRSRWITIANSLDITIKAVIFEQYSPEIHAKRRVKSDSRGHNYSHWLKVANIFANKYEQPTIEEGFNEILYWKFS